MWERPYGAPSWIGIFFLKGKRGLSKILKALGTMSNLKDAKGGKKYIGDVRGAMVKNILCSIMFLTMKGIRGL
jgi:hypothetical protein